MPRADAAKVLAESWHSLPHPDGRPRRLMHFSQFGQHPHAQQKTRELAADLGVSAIHALEQKGFTITHKDDVAPADAPSDYKVASLYTIGGAKLMDLGLDANLKAHLSRLAIRSLISVLQAHADG